MRLASFVRRGEDQAAAAASASSVGDEVVDLGDPPFDLPTDITAAA